MSETIPTEIRLACGCDVPYEIGQPIFNYYDRVAGEIIELATSSEPDTYGTDIKGMSFPDGKAWWTRTTAGFVDGSRMCCQAFAIDKGWHYAAQQSTNQEDNKENNMYNDTNELPATDKVANDTINTQAAHIVELEGELRNARAGRNTISDLVRTTSQGVRTIGEVLHSYAKDCGMKDEITEIIEKINEALDANLGVAVNNDSRFPRIKEITDQFEITVTYVITCDAKDADDALKQFRDGNFHDYMDDYEMEDQTSVEKAC